MNKTRVDFTVKEKYTQKKKKKRPGSKTDRSKLGVEMLNDIFNKPQILGRTSGHFTLNVFVDEASQQYFKSALFHTSHVSS